MKFMAGLKASGWDL